MLTSGVATLQTREFARWVADLVLVGAVVSILPLPSRALILEVAVACLGFTLLTEKGAAALADARGHVGRGYGSGCPPVTPRVSPLTKLDSWEARKTKAGASSAGCAGRPIGEVPPNWETVSPGIEAGMIGVHTGPGATELALSPYWTTSMASPLVNVTMAPLVAE